MPFVCMFRWVLPFSANIPNNNLWKLTHSYKYEIAFSLHYINKGKELESTWKIHCFSFGASKSKKFCQPMSMLLGFYIMSLGFIRDSYVVKQSIFFWTMLLPSLSSFFPHFLPAFFLVFHLLFINHVFSKFIWHTGTEPESMGTEIFTKEVMVNESCYSLLVDYIYTYNIYKYK